MYTTTATTCCCALQTFGTKFVFKRITTVLRVEAVGYLPSKPKAMHPFRVVTDGHIFLLSAPTADERTAWMRVLTQVSYCFRCTSCAYMSYDHHSYCCDAILYIA
jgi:hypothetical protein